MNEKSTQLPLSPQTDLLSLADQLAEAARPAYEILTALAIAVDWELHPSILAKIREVAPKLGNQLSAYDKARGKTKS